MEYTEKRARYTLSKVITPRKFREILDHYPNIEDYCLQFKIPVNKNTNLENAYIYGDENYPNSLINIPDAPIILYSKGSLQKIPEKTVAIVGTRRATDYGIRATKKITEYFIERGYCIVSGLASGVDAIAHQVAIDNKSKTIAVLGTDVDTPYPLQNKNIYKSILENGLIISENEKKEDYNKWSFPRRNRIIAGISEIVIIVEAPIKSGAIITANFAFDYGKKLFALPGNIFQPNSSGCNLLINQNKAEIFIDSIIDSEIISQNAISIESKILKLINSGVDTLDDLQIKLYIPKLTLQEIVLKLEFSKLIAKDLFGRYIVVC
jgi:DNA processing protein